MAEPSLAQDWTELAEMDPTANLMMQHNIPMTPENYNEAYGVGGQGEMPEELPAALQGFSGVGLSEMPQGPMPLPEGAMGTGPQSLAQQGRAARTLVEGKPAPAIARAENALRAPLEEGGPSGGGQFQVSRAFKPSSGNQQEE